jgi:hypothetical protein
MRRAIEVVLFLFASFGGFLTNIAPPQSLIGGGTPVRSVQIASFLTLMVLLLVSALVKISRKRRYRLWIGTASIFFVSFVFFIVVYSRQFNENTFYYFDGTRVVFGKVQMEGVAEKIDSFRKTHPGEELTKADLLAKFGGIHRITSVWTEASIRAEENKLETLYLISVLSLAISMFSLTEGVFLGR